VLQTPTPGRSGRHQSQDRRPFKFSCCRLTPDPVIAGRSNQTPFRHRPSTQLADDRIPSNPREDFAPLSQALVTGPLSEAPNGIAAGKSAMVLVHSSRDVSRRAGAASYTRANHDMEGCSQATKPAACQRSNDSIQGTIPATQVSASGRPPFLQNLEWRPSFRRFPAAPHNANLWQKSAQCPICDQKTSV
jgi:hypothetical protein